MASLNNGVGQMKKSCERYDAVLSGEGLISAAALLLLDGSISIPETLLAISAEVSETILLSDLGTGLYYGLQHVTNKNHCRLSEFPPTC